MITLLRGSVLLGKAFQLKDHTKGQTQKKKFGIYAYPSHYVIDKKGSVRFYQKSYRPGTGNIIDHEISELLTK